MSFNYVLAKLQGLLDTSIFEVPPACDRLAGMGEASSLYRLCDE
jgi:hypothetical protein